ncbi:MAG: hypothetical protein HZB16_22640 [Armatimonadetes bacterium]|nr:hypothetical protein [Armatimonadota bacterium]
MWLILGALGAVLLMLKTAVTYAAVALTALVAVGNELRRWPVLKFLEGRQIALRRAWGTSLLAYFLLAVAYAWAEQRTDALVVDCLGIVVMVSTVMLLAQRKSLREVRGRRDDEVPAEPRASEAGRRPRTGKLVDVDDDGDESLSPSRPRRRRRVPRD